MATSTQKIEKGYKQTDVGIIPDDWNVARLGDYLARRPRYGIGAAAVEYSDRLPKYIRITDISEDGRFLPDKSVSVDNLFSANYFLSDGDIVVARTGASVGKSYLYKLKDGPLVFAGFLICLTPDEDRLLPEYLNAYLKTTSYWNWVRLTSMRSGQPGINGNEYAQLLFPLPEISEQRVIGETLSNADALIEKIENLIDKKANIKKGAMQELLTGKKRLPGFSGKWETKKMGDLGFFYKGRGISSKDLVQDGLPCIMYGDIYVKFDTKFSNPDFRITEMTAAKSALAKTGDLFFTASGETAEEIGKCVVYQGKENIYIGGDIIAMTPNQETDSLFLAYMQNSSGLLSQKATLGQGHTVVHIYTEHIKALKLPLPPTKKEQTAIATILSDMDTEIESLKSQLSKYRNLKQGMMQRLLTGKIRLLAK